MIDEETIQALRDGLKSIKRPCGCPSVAVYRDWILWNGVVYTWDTAPPEALDFVEINLDAD